MNKHITSPTTGSKHKQRRLSVAYSLMIFQHCATAIANVAVLLTRAQLHNEM